MDETCTATITLREKAKYLPAQKARDIHYSDEQREDEPDEVFGNFRVVNGMGALKENILYRSASPCDNEHNCAADFSEKPARGLATAAGHEGPFLVHCVEGKDRTGYVMMILEALAGATYREILDDYMLTYDNYYQINQTTDPERYQIIREKNIDEMIAYMTGMDAKADFSKVDLALSARRLLIGMGMTEEQVNLLKSKIADVK